MRIPDMVKKQLAHRSIRHYQDKALDDETIKLLLQVANASATSNGLQNYSMLIVKDPLKKEILANIAKQDYIRKIPYLVLFMVDTYRNTNILKQHGIENVRFNSMDIFFQGYSDALIGAQSMVTAAEALDLGSLYIGSVLNEPQILIEMFALPKLTMPILAVGIGHPEQIPAIKPKLPLSVHSFVDEYNAQVDYIKALQGFNEAIEGYVDLRYPDQPGIDFITRLINKNATSNPKREAILEVIQAQGFDINYRKEPIHEIIY